MDIFFIFNLFSLCHCFKTFPILAEEIILSNVNNNDKILAIVELEAIRSIKKYINDNQFTILLNRYYNFKV